MQDMEKVAYAPYQGRKVLRNGASRMKRVASVSYNFQGGSARSCSLIHDITRSGVVTARCPAPYCYLPPCHPFNPRGSLTTPSTLHQRYPCVRAVCTTCLFTSSCIPHQHTDNATVTRLNPILASNGCRDTGKKKIEKGRKKKEICGKEKEEAIE